MENERHFTMTTQEPEPMGFLDELAETTPETHPTGEQSKKRKVMPLRTKEEEEAKRSEMDRIAVANKDKEKNKGVIVRSQDFPPPIEVSKSKLQLAPPLSRQPLDHCPNDNILGIVGRVTLLAKEYVKICEDYSLLSLANITLRRENQELEQYIQDKDTEHKAKVTELIEKIDLLKGKVASLKEDHTKLEMLEKANANLEECLTRARIEKEVDVEAMDLEVKAKYEVALDNLIFSVLDCNPDFDKIDLSFLKQHKEAYIEKWFTLKDATAASSLEGSMAHQPKRGDGTDNPSTSNVIVDKYAIDMHEEGAEDVDQAAQDSTALNYMNSEK